MPDRFEVTVVRTYRCEATDEETALRLIRELGEDAEPDADEWFVALVFDDEEAT